MKTKGQILREVIEATDPAVAATMYQIIQMYPELPLADDGSFLMKHKDFKYHLQSSIVFYSHIDKLIKAGYLTKSKLKKDVEYKIVWEKLAP